MSQESMISYSASFEDVMLYRALKHVQNGFYVDVGASNPLIDSNTAAFYKKDWRGICIEPLPEITVDWALWRPEDLLISALVGSQQGEATLYVYDDVSQISTCSVETMERWSQHKKLHDKEIVVPVVTLNQVMEEFLNERIIHLLCIDVEGSEKNVLDGFDLKKYCPWIIVVEAVLPGTQIPGYEHWEGDVLNAGYTMVYEDGFNRFYLSTKKVELKKHFMYPPNAWDKIIPYKQSLAEESVVMLERENEGLKAQVQVLQKMLAGQVNLPDNFWDFVPHIEDVGSQKRIAMLEEDNEKLKRHIKGLQQEAALHKFLNQ